MSDFFNGLNVSSKSDKIGNVNFVSNSISNGSAGYKFSFYNTHSDELTANVVSNNNITFIDSGADNEKNKKDGSSSNKSSSIETNKFIKNVIAYLQSENYIDGEISKTQLYLEMLYYKYPFVFKDIFQKIWLKMYVQNPHHLRDFICISAGLEYEWLGDCADVLILGAFSHNDDSVHEAAIRAIESWDQPEHSELISQTRPLTDEYLENYRQSVLNSLRK